MSNYRRDSNDEEGGNPSESAPPTPPAPPPISTPNNEETREASRPSSSDGVGTSRTSTSDGAGPLADAHTDLTPANHVHNYKHKSSHSIENLLTPLDSRISTMSKHKTMCAFSTYASLVEPKNVKKALLDDKWISAIQEDLLPF